MADVIRGACRTMPGTVHRCPPGQMCDNHPERLAVVRIQGETDSFGAELGDYCGECRDAIQRDLHNPNAGPCDVCSQVKDDLKPWRDPEEGVAGRLYNACGSCRQAAANFHRDATGADESQAEDSERDLVAGIGDSLSEEGDEDSDMFEESDFSDPSAVP